MGQPGEVSSDEHLERSLQLAAASAAQMRKTLESPQGKLLVAIKQVSTMLAELATDKLPPRSYYEIYNVCFDALSQLQEYLLEDHKNHHLADVYEIVEYTGNVLPRLYLMITVGSAFMATGDAPRQEVLKDMLEMARGIQNPLRGLFLRFYLGQRTRQSLAAFTKADLQFSVAFTITNFVEMNKLWVRYQHQGHSRNYEQRTKERIQLQTVVGSSILRLAQLDAVDINVFRDQILPAVLDQVVECRDKLAQEYLLDIIVQAFPAEFHLETLALFLDCIQYLSPEASVTAILLVSMSRTIGYARTKFEELKAQEHEEQTRAGLAKKITGTSLNAEQKDDAASVADDAANETPNGVPQDKAEDVGLDALQDKHDETQATDDPKDAEGNKDNVASDKNDGKHNEEVPDSSSANEGELKPESEDTKSAVSVFDDKVVEQDDEAKPKTTPDSPRQAESDKPESSPENAETKTTEPSSEPREDKPASKEADASEKHVDEPEAKVFRATEAISLLLRDAVERYWNLLQQFEFESRDRARLTQTLLELSAISYNTLSLPELFKGVVKDKVEQSKEMETLLLTLFELELDLEDIMELFREFPTLLASQAKVTRHAIAEKVINQILQSSTAVSSVGQTRQVLELFSTLLRSGGLDAAKVAQFVSLIKGETVLSTLELLELSHKIMREGGQVIVQQTTSVIVNATLLLLSQSSNAGDVAKILKFVNRACHDLASVGNAPLAAYRLHLSGARTADSAGAEEAAYEFFAQALAIYEESITESHQQVNSLALAIHALQSTSVFTTENYVPLAQRCTQYSQRLLRKSDQCRSLLLAAHLYWDNDYSDARAVEETLNRALRSADSVMDVNSSIDLFSDVLDTNLYFLANDTVTVTAGRINSLLKLIEENIENARTSSSDDVDSKTIALPALEARLERIKKFIRSQMQAFPSFAEIEIRSPEQK